jgi:hypothetical protein
MVSKIQMAYLWLVTEVIVIAGTYVLFGSFIIPAVGLFIFYISGMYFLSRDYACELCQKNIWANFPEKGNPFTYVLFRGKCPNCEGHG